MDPKDLEKVNQVGGRRFRKVVFRKIFENIKYFTVSNVNYPVGTNRVNIVFKTNKGKKFEIWGGKPSRYIKHIGRIIAEMDNKQDKLTSITNFINVLETYRNTKKSNIKKPYKILLAKLKAVVKRLNEPEIISYYKEPELEPEPKPKLGETTLQEIIDNSKNPGAGFTNARIPSDPKLLEKLKNQKIHIENLIKKQQNFKHYFKTLQRYLEKLKDKIKELENKNGLLNLKLQNKDNLIYKQRYIIEKSKIIFENILNALLYDNKKKEAEIRKLETYLAKLGDYLLIIINFFTQYIIPIIFDYGNNGNNGNSNGTYYPELNSILNSINLHGKYFNKTFTINNNLDNIYENIGNFDSNNDTIRKLTFIRKIFKPENMPTLESIEINLDTDEIILYFNTAQIVTFTNIYELLYVFETIIYSGKNNNNNLSSVSTSVNSATQATNGNYEEIQQLQNQLTSLLKERDNLESEILAYNLEHEKNKETIAKNEAEINAKVERIIELEALIEDMYKQINKLMTIQDKIINCFTNYFNTTTVSLLNYIKFMSKLLDEEKYKPRVLSWGSFVNVLQPLDTTLTNIKFNLFT